MMLILLPLEFGITTIKVTCRQRVALGYRSTKQNEKLKLGNNGKFQKMPTKMSFQ